jgi:tetraacyldisaccharide 4'-kinase
MFAPSFWYQPKPSLTAWALWPLSVVYGAVAELHGKSRAKNPYYAGVPVISVGNITVGGTGKTPVVQWLAAHYAARGHMVAVISRGYGGQCVMPLQVSNRLHSAEEVGDEPLAMARHFEGMSVSVWVGRNRPAVVRRAEQAGATLMILDDGFQRRDVARDVDMLVLNGAQGSVWGNGLCMPAGPLRERLNNRKRAHFAVVLNEPVQTSANPLAPLPYYGLPAFRLVTEPTPETILPLKDQPLIAFAGIGHPEKFVRMLAQYGLTTVAAMAFPDHHVYTPANLAYLKARAAEVKAVLVTTEKDAAKLPEGFAEVVKLRVGGPGAEDVLAEIRSRIS